LNDHWGLSEGVQYHLKIFFEKFLNMRSNFTRFDILTSPSFMLYIMALAMVTIMEAFVTIKICNFFPNNPPIAEPHFRVDCSEKVEMTGLGISNMINGLFGL
jgi:hypothetical protein